MTDRHDTFLGRESYCLFSVSSQVKAPLLALLHSTICKMHKQFYKQKMCYIYLVLQYLESVISPTLVIIVTTHMLFLKLG